MCGYDPFYNYELELDKQYAAYEHGFNSVEEYDSYLEDSRTNEEYERFAGK